MNEYDVLYSLTKEETGKMHEWEKKHNKKFHKKGFGYQGAIAVSNFEVRIGTCSIGTWIDCVCLDCFKKYESNKDNLSEKKNEKELAKCSYSVRELS